MRLSVRDTKFATNLASRAGNLMQSSFEMLVSCSAQEASRNMANA